MIQNKHAHQVKRANGRCTLRVTAIFKMQRRSFLEATGNGFFLETEHDVFSRLSNMAFT